MEYVSGKIDTRNLDLTIGKNIQTIKEIDIQYKKEPLITWKISKKMKTDSFYKENNLKELPIQAWLRVISCTITKERVERLLNI